jgi:predicted DNA-binding ribbon-helix-helix protein
MAKNNHTMSADTFDWSQPQPKIVQHQKRRFALRLEAIYWRQLEALADRRGWRVGRLVAGLARDHQGPNLSSYVRGYCMVEAERDIARYRLTAGSFDLTTLLRGCPSPALLLNEERKILDTNQALTDWLGEPNLVLRQRKFDEIFVPRVLRPLDETMTLMRQKTLQRAIITVTYQGALQGPGNTTRTVNATLTALPVGQHFYCLVWLAPSPGRAAVPLT